MVEARWFGDADGADRPAPRAQRRAATSSTAAAIAAASNSTSPGNGVSGGKAPVVHVVERRVGSHDGGAQAARADVDHEHGSSPSARSRVFEGGSSPRDRPAPTRPHERERTPCAAGAAAEAADQPAARVSTSDVAMRPQCTSLPATRRIDDEHRLRGEVRADGGDDAVGQRQAARPGATRRARRRGRSRRTSRAASDGRPAAVVVARRRRQRATSVNGHGEHEATDAPARIARQSQRPAAGASMAAHHVAAPNGERSPSLPGLRMPFGSSASFTAASTSRPVPSASATNRARFSPTPWWCDEVAAGGEHGALAGVPQRHVGRLDLVGRRGGGEREVQAGAVEVAVRQVARRGPGVRHGEQRRAHVVEDAPAARATARRSPSCRPRSPCGSAPAARWCRCGGAASRSTSASSSGGAPAAHSSATTAIVASTIAGSPSSSTSSTQLRAVAAVAALATRPRRTGAARPAWRRGAGSAGRPRGRRRTRRTT